MSTQASYYVPIYSTTYLVLTWLFTALALLSLGLRLAIRWQRFSHLFWDDFFVILAFALLLGTAIQPTIATFHYRPLTGTAGGKWTVVWLVSFNTSLWSVKIAFLLFFKRLGTEQLTGLKRYWWAVLGLTIVSYGALYTTNDSGCYWREGLEACSARPEARRMSLLSIRLNCTLDVLTDVLIMTIPFYIVSKIRISRRQRLILFALFSLVVITIIVAVLRVIVSMPQLESRLDCGLIELFGHLQATIALIVVCAGSFRALFTQDRRDSRPTPERPSYTLRPVQQARGNQSGLNFLTSPLPTPGSQHERYGSGEALACNVSVPSPMHFRDGGVGCKEHV
ncbi:hypothetical protein BDV95DRAFT_608128 [Massariosphaeria phaeospora]|uniref:Rhodopsin domain-containing protein n=1 Tax=Massariosphaeria phaeospora TaxID=100035 RepID=A0A7C8I5Y9_9PLEO|nr:hypothetical protein BDV95DRAFT_608128 [Massariosphaeria phaeospora]